MQLTVTNATYGIAC